MSAQQVEIKDSKGKIHTYETSKIAKVLESGSLRSLVGHNSIDESCQIKNAELDWLPLTNSFRQNIINANGDVSLALEWDQLRLQQEKEAIAKQRLVSEEAQRQKQEREAEAQAAKEADLAQKIEDVNDLRSRCKKGSWSLEDLKYLAELLQRSGTAQEDDPLSYALKELKEEVVKNPSLTEPIKLMYAIAQLELQQRVANSQHEMQQQILAALEHISSNQSLSNTILKQNQKSRNMITAASAFGATRALSELGDINDALGGDE